MCAPSAPNPTTTASAQTASNRETAISQAGLNAVNQITPQGNLSYEQIGTWPDGTPRFQATQSLTPQGQQLFNTGQQTQQNLANLAQGQSARLPALLNEPIDFSAQKDYLEGLTSGALDKHWDRQAEQFETQLVNRGLRPGSTGYQQQLGDFMTNRSDAYNSANVSNYNTALQSQMALRQAPINEILALAGQGQVQQPQFTNTPQTQVGGVDVAGITQNAFNQQMAGYNAGQQQLGGLFSAGASLIPLLSDERVKANFKKIAEHPVGVGVYEYDRLDTGVREIGVIAQHLEKIRPDLVDSTNKDGLKRVWYGKLNAEFPNAIY